MQSTVKDLAVEYKLPSSLNLTNIRSIDDKLKYIQAANVTRNYKCSKENWFMKYIYLHF